MGRIRRRRKNGLAWPAPDVGPTPPPEYRSRERDEERLTRKRMVLWDRIKLLLLLTVAAFFILSASITSNPPLQLQFLKSPPVGVADAIMLDLGTYVVLAVLAGLEVVRQFHYLVSEHWSAYHLFWTRKVFSRLELRRGRMDDWTRYRVQRVFRIGFLLVVADLVLAAVFDLPIATALIEAPGAILGVLPLALRLVFGFFFVIVQFVGLFWFLSRGGVDVYFPDDIKTRFTDVWGQDNVLEKIKENMVFLEDPERIEARGGFVPGGILLWGPPGTGKGEPVSARIMTPSGPRRMGDLVPGDRVIGSDGRPTAVREVHVLGERDLYRVHFSDGTSVRVTHDHLWLVRTADGVEDVRSLAELLAEVHDDGRPRYRIPMVEPVEFDERAVPLHPYLLGVLLAAGSMHDRITLSTRDRRVLQRVEDLLPDGDGLVAGKAGEQMIVGGATRTALKELDLLGMPEDQTFLPDDYLWNRVKLRLDLLRGLGDGGGRVDPRGAVRFHPRSARMAHGLAVLIRSFGGTCDVAADASPGSTVRATLPAGLVPFGVSAQRERLAPAARELPERRIVAITPAGREQARCLRVAAPDHLYVTENFTVTHNTLMAEAVAGETGKPFVFVDPGAFAQPLDSLVLTPSGWAKMGDLRVGDRVIGRDGRPHRVLGVYPQGERQIFRVRFGDGGETRVTEEHLWAVQTRWLREQRSTRWYLKQTRELKHLRLSPGHGWRFSVPIVSPVEFEERPVPLDPYVLGVLLGGGCFTGGSVMLVNQSEDLIECVRMLLPAGVSVSGTAPRYRLVGLDVDARSRVRRILEDLGLAECLAHQKFVPDAYLYNSADVRLALLRGLMDTDGAASRTASGGSWVSFGTSSPRLRDDVVELARSLGGLTKVHERPTGSAWQRRTFWQIGISLPASINPFAVKRERVVPRRTPLYRYITAIEPDGSAPAQCILVDSDDHLYVTDDYVVTHNTNMFLGVGILKVKSLFRKARKLALRYGGVILFFDEADSLGSRGALAQPPGGGPRMGELDQWARFGGCNGLSYLEPATAALVWHAGGEAAPRGRTRDGIIMGGMGGGGMGTLNALLTELSGLKKPRGFFNRVVRRAFGLRPKPPPKYRIMVMMATNLPQALDEALLRPGRIDRIYKVGYPSKPGRIRTYQGYFDKVSHELTGADLDKLATITPYATGASMKDLVNESLINAIRASRERIVWSDVVKAKHLKDLGPPEDVEYIERERHAVAVHEACHAVMAYRVRQHLTIDIATIEKGGTYLGMVASIPPEDQFTRWRSEYESDILVSLASLAGERLFFDGDNSSGVSGDLESATRVATMMEGYWGMGTTVASHGVTRQAGIPGGRGGPGGEDDRERDLLSGDLGGRIENKLANLLTRAEELLADDRREVFAVAHALELHKTVTGDDVRAIIDGGPGPLIDGRPYHTDAFLEAAEAYHQRMVEAHRAHAKPDVPLPEFPALAGVSASGDGQATQVAEPAESATNSHPDEEPVA